MRAKAKLITFALSAMCLAGCGGGGGGTLEFTVTFDVDGGSAVAAQKVAYGQKATRPSNPTKDGYTFDNWFADKYKKVEFDFNMEITADWTIYASWTASSTPSSSEVTPTSSEQPSADTSNVPTGDITYTCTDMPTWIKDDGCVIFAWAWSPSDQGSWRSLEYEGDTAAKFTVNEELTGFLLARCAQGTTTPDWNIKDNKPGRVYNKTEDITCASGVYSYKCAKWVEYK